MLLRSNFCGLILLVGIFTIAGCSKPAETSSDSTTSPTSYAGNYIGDKIRMEMKSDDSSHYTGTIILGDKKFPLTGTASDKVITGTFTNGADKFDFTTTAGDAGSLVLKTGQSSYQLKKEIIVKPQPVNPLDINRPVNPLERPQADNPLGAPHPVNPLSNPQPVNPLANP